MSSLLNKYSSNKSPIYLVQVFYLTFWPLKRKFIFLVICSLGDQKITRSVLLTYKAISFAISHLPLAVLASKIFSFNLAAALVEKKI